MLERTQEVCQAEEIQVSLKEQVLQIAQQIALQVSQQVSLQIPQQEAIPQLRIEETRQTLEPHSEEKRVPPTLQISVSGRGQGQTRREKS